MTLTKHFDSYHGNRLYECSICSVKYHTKATLKKHFKTKHDDLNSSNAVAEIEISLI
jgi:nickel-dependent lactate racemase